jgi:addiction module HigA family antidote
MKLILNNITERLIRPFLVVLELIMSESIVAPPTCKVVRDAKRAPIHPGEILREDVLPALNMPVRTAAKHLGVTRQTLHRILAGTMPVTPAMALRLGKFCGNGPVLWLNIQSAYDLWEAERELGAQIAKIPTQRAA